MILVVFACVGLGLLAHTYFKKPHISDSSMKVFGNEVSVDIDLDGRNDRVFIATDSPGGSGTFFYVVAELNTSAGMVQSQAFFMGDRIAPQTTNVQVDANGKPIIVVNFADRKEGESFVVPPSVGKSLFLKFNIQTHSFEEVVR